MLHIDGFSLLVGLALSHDPTPVVLSGTVWRMVRRCVEVPDRRPTSGPAS